jgi:hypothetical protein
MIVLFKFSFNFNQLKQKRNGWHGCHTLACGFVFREALPWFIIGGILSQTRRKTQ